MDLITKLNLGSTAEIAIIIIVYGLTQAVKQTKIDNKWLPWITMILGIFLGLISVVVTGDHNYSSASVLGFLIGGFTSGLFDGFSAFVKKAQDEAKEVMTVFPDDLVSKIQPTGTGKNVQGDEVKDTLDETKGAIQNDSRSK